MIFRETNNGEIMDKDYLKIVDSVKCEDNKLLNAFLAFVSGGLIGLISQFFFIMLKNNYGFEEVLSYTIIFIFWVTLSSVLTGLGVLDKVASIFKAGIIIPSTGFSHAMTSAGMDNNREGFITGIGANMFKLTGSIILYGIVFAIICAFIKGVLF